ncbi:hypothetical protein MIR68_010828 [Amoeboaphelidium protococcarum]|nr:hypothetical protein MIR68_010828 [Amoeboaphelidium protococcarum]
MSQLQTLIGDALELEDIDVNLYRSKNKLWVPIGSHGVFGGQVLGQALVAANRSVPDPFVVHSLHSHFLLPGDPKVPIVFHVAESRDGKSFITRSVEAKQNGRAILIMTASFQRPEAFELEHQKPPPQAPPPQDVKSEEDRLKIWLNTPQIPSKYHDLISMRLTQPIPIEIKHVSPKLSVKAEKTEPQQMIWIRAKGDLGDSKQTFHQAVVAYASDHILLTTALLPHGLNSLHPKLKYMATLNHSMWFHAPFRADEYLLYEMESPRTGQNRGLVFGRIYTQDGRLVVTCAQEGLIRTRSATSDKQQSKL